jgi:conjugative relaxase-like TrwC/TraI family protein
MVATWTPAASAQYYSRQTGDYTEAAEPPGEWFARSATLGVASGALVSRDVFERLFAGVGADGHSLHTQGGTRLDRAPAFAMTYSAPRSVSLVWALGGSDIRLTLEAAQKAAVRETLSMLEREASWARRGKGGTRIEQVTLTAALFQHGDSRPAEHEDGRVFADPNLHTHAVILNLAPRADGTVGAIHSTVLRDWKMAAGATYHAALAAELEARGFAIDRIGGNGVFEVAGIPDPAIRYFAARRREIEQELAEAGTTSAEAVAYAAEIARLTRAAKREVDQNRYELWQEVARAKGIESSILEAIACADIARLELTDDARRERDLAERLAGLPDRLTETRSVVDRRDLVRAVAEAVVGTGFGAARVMTEVDRLVASNHVVEIGRDALNLPRYSTPELVRIEREIVEIALHLADDERFAVSDVVVDRHLGTSHLNDEQISAARYATASGRLAIVEGAPGTGKTTLFAPMVAAWKESGYRVLGTATAWRVANALRDDLNIEARATASWLAGLDHGRSFLDDQTVLVVDEAGLLSSRDMHRLLDAADTTGAKIVLAGDRDQLQAIGAGAGLALAAHGIEVSKVTTIVRQKEPWLRVAILEFGRGHAGPALEAFSEQGSIVEADGERAAVRAVVDQTWQADGTTVLLAKTNADVLALGREVRDRMRAIEHLSGPDSKVTAATPSGHTVELSLAVGDQIRFQLRNDALGVINGTTATITRIAPIQAPDHDKPRHFIEARVGDRQIAFDTADIADDAGRARLGWAYASTIYGAQGLTVDRAAVLVSPAMDRHDIYVAASRARHETTLVIDSKRVNREMLVEGAVADTVADLTCDDRLSWLSSRLSRSNVKETTFGVEVLGDGHRLSRHRPRLERETEAILPPNPTHAPETRKPVAEAEAQATSRQGINQRHRWMDYDYEF